MKEIQKDDEERYASMKKLILDALDNNYDLEELKNYFKKDINSLRTLNKIGTIKQLIEVLEQRDVLNYQCPMPLFYIGEILKKDDIKLYVTTYKKCYLEGLSNKCLCGEKLEYHPVPVCEMLQPKQKQLEHNINKSSTDGIHSPSTITDVKDAIKNVANRSEFIEFWRVLASELNIEEYIIDAIYRKYPKDEKEQAFAALNYWVEREKENATLELLDKALNARLCKKKGIGHHLRMPLSIHNL